MIFLVSGRKFASKIGTKLSSNGTKSLDFRQLRFSKKSEIVTFSSQLQILFYFYLPTTDEEQTNRQQNNKITLPYFSL